MRVGKFLPTVNDSPPSKRPASFTSDQTMGKWREELGGQ
jgi:hypothetical protein